MSTPGTSGKKSMGRQKIEMKKIANKINLQVAFSKRRNGLFKKANELCTLCGVELALIVFSPGEKAFSFGNPSVDAIIQRYLSQDPHQTSITMRYIEAQRSANVRDLNAQLTQVNNQLDAVRKHGDELNRLRKEAQAQFWWASQIKEMDRSQLEMFRAALVDLNKNVLSYGVTTTATNPPIHPFVDVFGGQGNAMIPFDHVDVFGGQGNAMIPFDHQLPPLPQTLPPLPQALPPLPQTLPPQFYQGSMMQAHHSFSFDNMGGYGGHPGFF